MKHEPVLTRRTFLGLSIPKPDDDQPFVYHTEHDGDIVFEDTTTARSSQPVVISEHAGDFTRT